MRAQTEENTRAVIGGNKPPADYRETELMRLRDEYPALEAEVASLLADARKLPARLTTDAELTEAARIAAAIRDKADAIEAIRTNEKEPHLIAGRAIDEFFFGQIDKCIRREKKAPAGAANIIEARITEYQTRIAAATKAAAEAAAAKAAAELAAKEKAAADARRAAEEAAAAAARARNPDRIEEKATIAAELAEKAQATQVDAAVASEEAHRTYVESLGTMQQLGSVKIDGGPKLTLSEENYATITDRAKLDKEALWPFIHQDALEKALTAWAKTHSYTKTMDGAAVGKRAKTKMRR